MLKNVFIIKEGTKDDFVHEKMTIPYASILKGRKRDLIF